MQHERLLTRLFVLVFLVVPTAALASQDATPVQPTTATASASTSARPLPPQEPPAWLRENWAGKDPAPTPTATTPPTPSTTTTPPVTPPASVSSVSSPFPFPSTTDGDAIFDARPIANKGVDVLAYTSVGVDWLRQVPSLSLGQVEAERVIASQRLSSAGALTAWRAQVGLDLVVSRQWVVAIGGLGIGSAVGASSRIITSVDGSPIEARPWTTGLFTLGGPGFGVRLDKRRWTFGGTARVVINYIWMDATVASGRTKTDVILDGWSASLRLDVEACRRVGPLDRACLYVETRAMDNMLLNGGSAGLRWEFGR